jgi:hypothetical protein
MKAGQVNAIFSDESYGFVDKEGHMAPPKGFPQGARLTTVVRLVSFLSASQVLTAIHRVGWSVWDPPLFAVALHGKLCFVGQKT